MNSSGVTESGESEKVLLLMESGVRLHTTAYVRYLFNISFHFIIIVMIIILHFIVNNIEFRFFFFNGLRNVEIKVILPPVLL
jgi:hypothetical protein